MSDCDVWKCAKKKRAVLQPPVEEEKKTEKGVMVKLITTEWPFPNYASRRLQRTQTEQKDLTESQLAADTSFREITLDLLRMLMGLHNTLRYLWSMPNCRGAVCVS